MRLHGIYHSRSTLPNKFQLAVSLGHLSSFAFLLTPFLLSLSTSFSTLRLLLLLFSVMNCPRAMQPPYRSFALAMSELRMPAYRSSHLERFHPYSRAVAHVHHDQQFMASITVSSLRSDAFFLRDS